MKFFKMFKLKSVRDRPGNKKKRKLSTVIVALICLLSIGVLSMLSAFSVSSSGGSSGSSSGGSSSQTPTPTPDGSDTGSSVLSPVRGANDIEILSLLDFSHPYEYKSDGLQIETNGFCIDERIQYGTVDTDNESLN